jgi:hypothetical protein
MTEPVRSSPEPVRGLVRGEVRTSPHPYRGTGITPYFSPLVASPWNPEGSRTASGGLVCPTCHRSVSLLVPVECVGCSWDGQFSP